MNAKLTKQLLEKYPKIFPVGQLNDPRKNLMCFGFDTGDGWYFIIDKCLEHIQSYLDHNPHLNIPQVVALQIKEKYGTLSIYYSGGDEYIEGIVSHAEWLSDCYCEECGTTEDVGMTQGWYSSVCRKHWMDSNLKMWKQYDYLYTKQENGDITIEDLR